MTKLKRTTIYSLLLILIAAISSLLVVIYSGHSSDEEWKVFWIIWLSSLIPIIVSGCISAFLYHYLCESKKAWVHVLWFVINLCIIVGFGSFLAFVVLSSMLN